MLLSQRRDMTADDQFSANRFVQLAAFVVCRADDQNALSRLMGSNVLARNLFAALFDVCDFADIVAPLKDRKRLRDLAFGSMRYGFAELGSCWRRMVSSRATSIPASCI